MINRMRELLPYPEVPIKLLIRGRAGASKAESTDKVRPAHSGKGRRGR